MSRRHNAAVRVGDDWKRQLLVVAFTCEAPQHQLAGRLWKNLRKDLATWGEGGGRIRIGLYIHTSMSVFLEKNSCLQNAYLLAKIGFDTTENEPAKKYKKLKDGSNQCC